MKNQKKNQNKREPMRTCIACRTKSPKKEMLRFVCVEKGKPMLDTKGKISGRGANVCSSVGCFDQAVEKGSLSRALKTPLNKEEFETIRDQVKAEIENRSFREGDKRVTIRVSKDEAEEKLGKVITRELTGNE